MFRAILVLVVAAFSFNSQAATWAEIESKTRRVNGFMPYHISSSQGKVWLEINRFNQPFIYYTGLPYGVGSNDIGLDRGQLSESRLVQFERYGDKVLLKQLNTQYRAVSDNRDERNSIREAFASSVLHGFKIEARLGKRVLVELTPFLLKDLHGVSNRLAALEQGSFNVDSSRSALVISSIKNFSRNTNFESLLTFKGSKPGKYVRQVVPSPDSLSVQQQVSFVALPDDKYQPRKFHPRSGFFELSFADYATSIEEPINQKLIYRHRIKRNKDGSIKPIIYYLDPGAPEPVRSALLDGAKWWGQAFDAIGLEGAYQVKMLPKGVDPLDVRYNVIQWVHRATRGWSYGGAISDPRTGEILKGHVTLGSLRVRQDLLLANALTGIHAEGAQEKAKAAKEMALARIRQLSAHEVGHTLGLAHNFAASPSNRASVMDYPHPYVSLRGGNVTLENAYAKDIGVWDIEAMRYGYGEFDPEKESQELRAILKNMQAKGLSFISDADARAQGGAHPTAHLWDNGSDPAKELTRVLAVRNAALAKFGHNNLAEGIPYSELAETLVPLYLFHRYQVEAAVKVIGGLYYEYSVKGDSFKPVKAVDSQQQEVALQAILSTLDMANLELPQNLLSIIPPKAYGYYKNRESFGGYTGISLDPVSMAEVSAGQSLKLLFNPERLARLLQQHSLNPEQLGLSSMMNQLLLKTLRSPEQQGLAALVQQRVDYLTLKVILQTAANNNASPEVRAFLFSEIGKLDGWLQVQAKRNPQRYLWLKNLLDQFMTGKFESEISQPVVIPPGSPIG